MMLFIIVIHVIICLGLICLVLIQRGRGAGLVESFAGVESMFGTKTSVFLTRATTILSIAFFITCLLLAVMSVRQSKSLMRNVLPQAPVTTPITDVVKEATQAAPKVEEKAQAAQAPVAAQPQDTQEIPKAE